MAEKNFKKQNHLKIRTEDKSNIDFQKKKLKIFFYNNHQQSGEMPSVNS